MEKTEMKEWSVRWRGIITRDIGTAIVRAQSGEDARRQYEIDHPTRRVTNVYQWFE